MSVGMNAPATWETYVHTPGGEPFTPSREMEGRLPWGWGPVSVSCCNSGKLPAPGLPPSAAQESWQWVRLISGV